MSSTYLQLTNRVLEKLGEVPLNQNNFDDARGLHSVVKQSINDVISEVNTEQYLWPFNAYEHSQTLIIGQNEYAWPCDFKAADWSTFQIQKDTHLAVNTKTLEKINREDWYQYYRDIDYDAGSVGKAIPEYCFEAHGNGFGVSPSPDKEYLIKFRYYTYSPLLTNATDKTTIPDEWEFIMYLGALWHGHMYKEDPDSADRVKAAFEDAMGDMRKIAINRQTTMRDTVINPGGSVYWRSPYILPR